MVFCGSFLFGYSFSENALSGRIAAEGGARCSHRALIVLKPARWGHRPPPFGLNNLERKIRVPAVRFMTAQPWRDQARRPGARTGLPLRSVPTFQARPSVGSARVFSPGFRRQLGEFAEKRREMTLIFEAATRRDFDERQFTFGQQELGALDATLGHVLLRREAGRLFESACEMKLAEPGGLGDVGQGQVLFQALVYEFTHPS